MPEVSEKSESFPCPIIPAMVEQRCPICDALVHPSARYPVYLCPACASEAVDSTGRALEFSNVSVSGGFLARYADTGEAYGSHECFVRGVRCFADEAYLGSIVVRPGTRPE